MSLFIQLLGRPSFSAPYEDRYRFRSNKSWGLLAYLILRERQPSREELSSLLFAEAEDPRRALRWNLSEIRKAIDRDGSVGGNPVDLALSPGVRVDVLILARGSSMEAVESTNVGASLLEGMTFDTPAFETWLLNERRHLDATGEAVLHEAALRALSRGDHQGAIDHALRLIQMNPLDENHQALLIRAFRLAGDLESAEAQLAACRRLFETELGISPGPAVEAAAKTRARLPARANSRASTQATLEAGLAAVDAGAIESGIDSLRTAVAQADADDDHRLRAETRIALAEALIHSLRGEDEEGTATLHEAREAALSANENELAARAAVELGYVDFLRARYDRAEHWLLDARDLAGSDHELQAAVAIYLGTIESDRANYANAKQLLRHGLSRAQELPNHRREAYASSVLGRAHLLEGELDEAARLLHASIELAEREHWLAFMPWPQALFGEVELKRGNLDSAASILEQAFARACLVSDPCWEGASARALALLEDARDNRQEAIRRLEDARLRCNRASDTYMWLDGYILDALCTLGHEIAEDKSRIWAEQLHELASRTGMKELTVRALLHKAQLGEAGAEETARLLAADIDNPELTTLIGR
jgi:DNA-binding SARP family transcriptional activator